MVKHKSKILLLILLGIVFTVNLFSNSIKISSIIENVNDTPIDLYNLRVGGPQINITTPKNTTYTKPMSGYYPATYGFENDLDASIPQEWIDNSQSGCSARVISEKDNHKKVVHLDDDSGNKMYFDNYFPTQTYGTIELWVNAEDASNGFDIRTNMFYLNIGLDKWRYVDNTSTAIVIPTYDGVYDPIDNTWYHLTIHFRCNGAPSYMGLSENRFKVIIDGYESIELIARYVVDYIDNFNFATPAATTTDGWIDAIGYSWDPDYNIGDNADEGLLLSFDLSFSPNRLGYSLDGQTNRTILGNTTIPFPIDDGLHRIQVFGNDSLGTICQSDIRYFTTRMIKINTPENITYTEPMSGYYTATYGFENDLDASIPQEWIDNSQSGCSARVISEKGNLKKVVHLDDDSGNKMYFDNYFPIQTYGTIELWVNAEDTSNGFDIRTNMFYLNIGLDKWRYVDNTSTAIVIPTYDGVYDPIDNTWYHLTIHFRCNGAPSYMGLSENRFKVIIDGYESIELIARYVVDYIDNFNFATPAATTTDGWIDAIGYSWDPDYNIGDNADEGLLLSFDLSFSPNWLGYSLDGQTNRTILGNTTIPFPIDDGLHRIQVFGNNSIGTIYQSEIRYFEIDTSSPLIKINQPYSDQFFGITAPTYEISIIELNLNTTWYSLNSGITNITFTGLTGVINQTLWNDVIDGDVSIIFYANDTWGFHNYTSITVRKETVASVSLISYAPYWGMYFVNKSTIFTINADDGTGSGVSIILYKINDSNWIEYSGPFDLSNYAYGDYNITYYSIDNVGNIEIEKFIIVELVEIPSEKPKIAGYHMIIMVCIISIFSIIIKKRFKVIY